ncbi:hypothetical protein LCGC14_3051810 [marine sediment metagenome]|uniref:Uncharacterized protein n=1 Tax=marine sediment metagenome TaxID=412755 RepID=A0A0F8ZCB9_9ZZZZ
MDLEARAVLQDIQPSDPVEDASIPYCETAVSFRVKDYGELRVNFPIAGTVTFTEETWKEIVEAVDKGFSRVNPTVRDYHTMQRYMEIMGATPEV